MPLGLTRSNADYFLNELLDVGLETNACEIARPSNDRKLVAWADEKGLPERRQRSQPINTVHPIPPVNTRSRCVGPETLIMAVLMLAAAR